MFKFFRTLFMVLLLPGFAVGFCGGAHAQEESTAFPVVFGWKTSGSEKLIARKAGIIKQIKDTRGIALSFGSLLGPTRIVSYDRGAEFLSSAKQAGLDFAIPAAPEFMYGLETFLSLARNPDSPRFISANLVDEKTRKPIVDPYALWYGSGRRICIIAMSDTEIIKQAKDAHIAGLDIISYDEALNNISLAVARENPDLVIVAGRMDREAVMQMAVRHAFVDVFITNNRSGGFTDKLGATSHVSVAGKPVYIGDDAGNYLGALTFRYEDDVESREFRDISVGDDSAPDKEIDARLTGILDKLKKQDAEESVIVKTGGEVASVLRKVFDVDVVLLDRQSLFYFPLKDSLTIFDVRKVIKPYGKVTAYSLPGSLLKSVREQSAMAEPDFRLLINGITTEGKVDSIPIQDETDYTVLTTYHLRTGGLGYEQFVLGRNETITDANMLDAVESFLVAKEERLKKLKKQKIWAVNLYLSLHSDFDKKDVNDDKELYGDDIPKSWRKFADYYQGNFLLRSLNNKLTLNKTMNKHTVSSYLQFSYSRKASKTHTQSGIVYDEPRNSDPVDFNTTYTYDLPNFPIKPYGGLRFNTFLYSGEGKHPLTASIKSGAKRKFPGFPSLELLLGLHGTRDYTTLKNTFGFECDIFVNKEFPAGKILKTPVKIESKTFITWDPLAAYNMAFKHENDNTIRLQIMEKISISLHFKSYSYRSTKVRKVATAYYYVATLDYGLNWKF